MEKIQINYKKVLNQLNEKLEMQKRCCIICDKTLIGRSDKVFCDIKCKNYYHQIVRASLKHYNKQTIDAQFKNHQILAGLMTENHNHFIIDQLALELKGFKFEYITGIEQKNGVISYNIFDYNFEKMINKRIIISVSKDRKPLSPFIFKRWNRVFKETV